MNPSEHLSSGFKKLRSLTKSLSRFKILNASITFLQNFYLIFRFIRDYRETNKYLRSEWGSLHPVYIPLISCNEINFPKEREWFKYNPTLILDKGKFRFFVRVTNVSNKPEVNVFGRLKKRGALSGTVNGIAEFALDDEFNPINYRMVVEPKSVPNFEDPKAFSLGNKVVLFCNLIKKEPEGEDRTFICQNAFIDLDSKKVTLMESPFGKNIEKNWIPVDFADNNLRMFYSCAPSILLNMNLTSGLISTEELEQGSRLDYHGGSQIVRLADDLLVRVVRRKMQMKNLGMVAISYLIFHDNNLRIVKISKPFLFRKFGFEICNGLARIDDYLIFTWGEDDIRNFIGRIKLNDVLDWAFGEDLQPH